MPFINGEPRIVAFLAAREPLFPRGQFRSQLSEILIKHGTTFRTPEHVARHISLVALPFLEELINRIIKNRGEALTEKQ